MSDMISTSACFQSTGYTHWIPRSFSSWITGHLDWVEDPCPGISKQWGSYEVVFLTQCNCGISANSSSYVQRVFVALCVSHWHEALKNSALKSGAMAPFKIAKKQVMEMIYALCQTVDPLRISVYRPACASKYSTTILSKGNSQDKQVPRDDVVVLFEHQHTSIISTLCRPEQLWLK